MTVAFVSAGEAAVVVSAAGAGTAATDTFVVHVTSSGPPGPAEGEADFVPIALGTVWAYDYSYESAPCGNYREIRSGRVTLAFQSEKVASGARHVAGEAHAAFRQLTTVAPYTFDTTYVDERYTFEAVETAEGVLFEGLDSLGPLSWGEPPVPLPRYHPATESVVRVNVTPYRWWDLEAGQPPQYDGQGASCGYGWPRVSLRSDR